MLKILWGKPDHDRMCLSAYCMQSVLSLSWLFNCSFTSSSHIIVAHQFLTYSPHLAVANMYIWKARTGITSRQVINHNWNGCNSKGSEVTLLFLECKIIFSKINAVCTISGPTLSVIFILWHQITFLVSLRQFHSSPSHPITISNFTKPLFPVWLTGSQALLLNSSCCSARLILSYVRIFSSLSKLQSIQSAVTEMWLG